MSANCIQCVKNPRTGPDLMCDECRAASSFAAPAGSAADVTKSTLPKKEWRDLAEDLLARFPGLDRADLLKSVVAGCFFEMKFGNKREERAACDLLNLVQAEAIKQLAKAGTIPPSPQLDKVLAVLQK